MPGQPRLHNESLSPKTTKQKTKQRITKHKNNVIHFCGIAFGFPCSGIGGEWFLQMATMGRVGNIDASYSSFCLGNIG